MGIAFQKIAINTALVMGCSISAWTQAQKLCKQLGWRVELFDRQYYLSTHE